MNPGLTFGTGSHATTRLCLTALEREVKAGMRVLDLGCGSGILSIAALLLGAERAFACDIDEKAVGVAYENAALNGIGKDRYAVRAGDVLADEGLRREMGGRTAGPPGLPPRRSRQTPSANAAWTGRYRSPWFPAVRW